MKLRRLTLTFYSPLISYPILADTLFGHLCWAIFDLEGETALEEFLDRYDEQEPPVLLSDAFPHGYVPRPYLKPLSFRQAYQWIQEREGDPWTGMAQLKTLHTVRFLERATWQLLSVGCDEQHVLQKLFESIPFSPALPTERTQVTVNRMTQQPLECFHSLEYPIQSLDIYVHVHHFSLDHLYTLLSYVGRIGYGQDHSLGKGVFQVNPPEEWETDELPVQGNRVMSLSTSIPCQSLLPYYYRLLPKYGRLGRTSHPSLKRPFLMHQAGSTYLQQGEAKLYYGSLLKEVHPTLSKVRQYAYSLVWPFQEY